MRIKTILAAAIVAVMPATGFAAGGAGHVTDIDFSFEGPFGTYDKEQLQRGFQVYNEVCSACHGLKFVSFRSLGEPGGPGYDSDQVKAFAAMYEVADEEYPGETRTAKASDKFPPNTGAGAPDLSLMAKARSGFHGPYGTGINQLVRGIGGPEYIYSILTSYNGHDEEVAGNVLHGNDAFPGGWISMGQPLYGDDVEYADGTPATLEQMAEDVSAFLMWTAEPKMEERKAAGTRNIMFMILLAVLLYLTNKKLWHSVKKRKEA